jgi:hypothetical protein
MPVNDADFGITSATSAAAIAAAVWDEPTSGHVSAGSFGALVANIAASVTRAWHAAMNRK